MALDGIVIHNIAAELQETLTGGRITKIAQPEKDELLLTVKTNRDGKREQYRLLISASGGLPLIYLTSENKPSPMTAPNFCMLLRKHLNNCQILSITQVDMERVLCIKLSHINELGDPCEKSLMVELMGKHSNIIFLDEKSMILDSIKHISGLVSSVREVLPGRDYFIPNTMDKLSPFSLTEEAFMTHAFAKSMPLNKAIYTTITGFSPIMANEVCHLASLDADTPTDALQDTERLHLYRNLERFIERIQEKDFTPNIVYRDDEPMEFASLPMTCYTDYGYVEKKYDTISEVLETYYAAKNVIARIRQKSVDLRKIVSTALERNYKKYDLQKRQLKDTEKRDKFKVYGELVNTYGYNLAPGAKSLTCENYYTGEEITIPLDPTKSALENSKRFFDKYGKLKRTFEALTVQVEETASDIEHLESISNALDMARQEADLAAIKEELIQYGYIRRKHTDKKEKKGNLKSKPLHYISSDGFHMYVGKNNFQNEELTFHFATGGDWWFHAKGIAGSHVVVKTNGEELPDRTFEEAGKLAGYYSKARGSDKAEIDYTEKKNVKKPNGSKPGFVVYYTNYSLIIEPTIDGIEEIVS